MGQMDEPQIWTPGVGPEDAAGPVFSHSFTPRQKVWVAVSGMYDSECVSGVYATAQAAIDAHPIDLNAKPTNDGIGWKWHDHADGGWWANGCDFSEHVSISEYEVEGG